jgi:integrase/recombinase XerD
MHTLQATRSIRKVALWFAQATLENTEIYLGADPTEKIEVLGMRLGKFKGSGAKLQRLHIEALR